MRAGAVAALLGAALLVTAACDARQHDDTLIYPKDEAAVAAAMAQARANLPAFWTAFDAAQSKDDFTMKVGLATKSEGVEHIWMNVTGREGDKIAGVIANEPFDIAGVALGSKVTVKPSQVSDWSYPKNGKHYGHFTTRVLLPQMSAEEQAQTRNMMSPNPLERPAQ